MEIGFFPLFSLGLGVQVLALVAVAFMRGWKAASLYLLSLPAIWLLALELVSGHIAIAVHLLWVAPTLCILWAVATFSRTHRSSTSSGEVKL